MDVLMKSSLTWKSAHSPQVDARSTNRTAGKFRAATTPLQNGWKHLTAALFATQPEVWSSPNRQGRTDWYVYDPVDEQLLQFDSDHEVRIWLERRYH